MKSKFLFSLSVTAAAALTATALTWADPAPLADSRDDFVLGMFTVPEQENTLSVLNLPKCKDSSNESVGAMKLLVKRYPLEVNGIAVIFASAGEPNIAQINNFLELKRAKDTGKIQANDFELFEAPNLESVINGTNSRTFRPDQTSAIMDIDHNSTGAKCVRKILFKGDSNTAGENAQQKSQILVLGSKTRGELNSITDGEGNIGHLEQQIQDLRGKLRTSREHMVLSRERAADAERQAVEAIQASQE
ncbi:MAG: hypothetical protein AAB425_06705 [Bdellovibrionota bacterium]